LRRARPRRALPHRHRRAHSSDGRRAGARAPRGVSEAVAPSTRTPQERRRASVRGVVQGVGFRPFVAKIARAHALVGFVRNAAEGVEIEVEGSPAALDAFACALTCPPPPARIETITWETLPS